MDAASTTASATPITTGTLILIAIGIVCAIAVIWWGTILRRRQRAAIAESEAHAEQAGHPIEEASPGAIEEPAPTASAKPTPAAFEPTPAIAHPVPDRDDAPALTQLKGLGPKAAAHLATLGIDRINQLAALNSAEAAALDARMGALSGRIARDRWIEQARLLDAGDKAGFEAAFGKLG